MHPSIEKFLNNSDLKSSVGSSFNSSECLLLPGSFNPFHLGHQGLFEVAEKKVKRAGFLELSLTNVDKPELDINSVLMRLNNIPEEIPIILTRAPTFMEKIELFPGAFFAMGYDTLTRVLDPSYNNVSEVLEKCLSLECKFVVAGRLFNNKFLSLKNLDIDSRYSQLFIPISEKIFRKDLSSTQIRSHLRSN